MASTTSPEHGAQHECNRRLSAPLGSVSVGRFNGVLVIYSVMWLAVLA